MDKNMLYRNAEGYPDRTAGAAMQKVYSESRHKERNGIMAKKRSCRRTTDENVIHEKAVKMRKMTDEQLVHYVEDRVEKARSEGFNRGSEQAQKPEPVNVTDILKEIGDIRGIGSAKLLDIGAVLDKYLEVQGNV